MTQSPDMVERVAAHIAAAVPLMDGSHWAPGFVAVWPKDYSQSERTLRRHIARGAVAAMRDLEKGNGLIGAGGVAMFKADMAGLNPHEKIKQIWVAMIDTALQSPDLTGGGEE